MHASGGGLPRDTGMMMSQLKYSDMNDVSKGSYVLADKATGSDARVYNRNSRMMRDRVKHVRQRQDARDQYSRPVTESQRYGWFPQVNEPSKPVHGKSACKETKLAEHALLVGDLKTLTAPRKLLSDTKIPVRSAVPQF